MGKKLLVADDSLTIQKVIRLALSNEGYEIQAVSDGNDAVQQISLFRPDVVLIDVSLPGKTAFEVKKVINDQGDLDEVRFILMSSAFEKVDEEQADSVRFHGRLTKPFDPAHLRQVLSEVLAQVTAKRMEPTSILVRPTPSGSSVAPPMAGPPPKPVEIEEPPTLEKISLVPPDNNDTALEREGHEELELMAPIQPEPEIPLAAPILETKSDAMDLAISLSVEPPPLPSASTVAHERIALPPTPPPMADSSDSDIRHLTESTIRMSGLDEFQWSVSEPNSTTRKPQLVGEMTLTNLTKQEPELKPGTQLLDVGGTNFSLEEDGLPEGMPPFRPEQAESAHTSLSFDPASSYHAAPSGGHDFLSSSSSSSEDDEDRTSPSMPSMSGMSTMQSLGMPSLPPPPSLNDSSVLPLTTGQMEAMLTKQLEETLQKMAQKILPEVAERILKQEINRMLHDKG